MYYDRRITVPQPPKAYKVTGKYAKTITPEELKEDYDYSVEWGYTDENFDTWRTQLLRQGKIKAIY